MNPDLERYIYGAVMYVAGIFMGRLLWRRK